MSLRRAALVVSLIVAAASFVRPTSADDADDESLHVEGAPIPAAHHLERRSNRKMKHAGIATFASSYVVAVLLGIASRGERAGGWLFVPIAGPVVYSAATTIEPGEASAVVAIGLGGVAQCAGVVMTLVGFREREIVVPDHAARVRIAPFVSTTTTGLSLAGAF